MQRDLPSNIERIKATASQGAEPDCPLGEHCNKPYPCVYKNWCYRNLPENNIFIIGHRMFGANKEKGYNAGIISFEDVLQSGLKLNKMQMIQVRTAVNNLPPHIETNNIRCFLDDLSYPLYHLDFETIQPPIPLWDNSRPYQQTPFQYSLHIQNKPCAEPEHREFLAKEGEDPRRSLAEHLCNDIPRDVCILAYNASFEKSCIKNLAEVFHDLSAHLMDIYNNIKDLADPFSKGYYYTREMGGSYSIKNVLPALCGGSPELDYSNLELIHHGGEAMASFADLHKHMPDERKKIRSALLAYCRLDTLAMVKLLEKLYQCISDE